MLRHEKILFLLWIEFIILSAINDTTYEIPYGLIIGVLLIVTVIMWGCSLAPFSEVYVISEHQKRRALIIISMIAVSGILAGAVKHDGYVFFMSILLPFILAYVFYGITSK